MTPEHPTRNDDDTTSRLSGRKITGLLVSYTASADRVFAFLERPGRENQ